jgi:integrase
MTQLLSIHDLCEIFGRSRTATYAITRRPGFPAPHTFSPRRRRWEREAVLTYRESSAAAEQLPRPKRVYRQPATFHPDRRIIGYRVPISGAHGREGQDKFAIVTAEGVKVYPPLSEGRPWKAVWTEPNGRRGSCTAKSEAHMAARLDSIGVRLRVDAPNALRRGSALVEYYLSQGWKPAEHAWSRSYRTQQRRLCDKHVLPVLESLQCSEIRAPHLQAVVDKASSASCADKLAGLIRSLVRVGTDGGYLTDQSLSEAAWRCRTAPPRTAKAAVQGRSKMFQDPGFLPSHDDVAALGRAMGEKHSRWELATNLAAYSGIRLGEMIGLRATSFHPAERSFRVTVQVQEADGAQTEEPPKRGKTRTVIFPHTTPGGYPLEEAVRLRIDDVQRELLDGSNPRGLMFPGDKGGWVRRSHLNDRIVKPAYLKAGWRGDQADGAWTWHTLRHVFCTTALADWKFSLTLVAQLAGHANTQITSERYVDPVAGVLERALAAIGNTPTDLDGRWGDTA